MGQTLYLRIEGVNFSNTVMDCDDLASIRGSSWALLSTPAEFTETFARFADNVGAVTPVTTGGSVGVYRLETDKTAEELEVLARACLAGNGEWNSDLAPVLPFLTFSVAALPSQGSYRQTEAALKNRAAISQHQQIDLDIPATDEPRIGKPWPCQIDGVRPRTKIWTIRESPTKEYREISSAIEARKIFGSKGRRAMFYREHAGLPKVGYQFADNFEEIAFNGRRPDGVPARLFGKMAVLYMDVNALGKIRAAYMGDEGTEDNARDFAAQEIGPHRRNLLRALVEHMAEDPHFCLNGETLRLETLLWGGDENLFVFPAWGLFSVLGFLEQHLKGQKCSGANLSYGIGVVVCRHKTPIRLVAGLARDLSDNAKTRTKEEGGDFNAYRSYVDICALSGYEVPMEHISVTRLEKDGVEADRQPYVYSLPLDGIDELCARLSELRGISGDESAGIPRAKLIETLKEARGYGLGGGHSTHADEVRNAKALFEGGKYLGPDGTHFPNNYFETVLMPFFEDAPLAFLHHVVGLWDHLDNGDAP